MVRADRETKILERGRESSIYIAATVKSMRKIRERAQAVLEQPYGSLLQQQQQRQMRDKQSPKRKNQIAAMIKKGAAVNPTDCMSREKKLVEITSKETDSYVSCVLNRGIRIRNGIANMAMYLPMSFSIGQYKGK